MKSTESKKTGARDGYHRIGAHAGLGNETFTKGENEMSMRTEYGITETPKGPAVQIHHISTCDSCGYEQARTETNLIQHGRNLVVESASHHTDANESDDKDLAEVLNCETYHSPGRCEWDGHGDC